MTQEPQIRHKVVDTREPEEIKQELLSLGWQSYKLNTGDYYFQSYDFKRIGFTRKTVPDMLGSIGDRFSKQLEEMIDCYDICILLLEGSWSRVSGEKIQSARGIEHFTWDITWNYIHRWQAKGFILELTTSAGHTIHRLNKLFALYQKPYSMSARTRQFTDDRVLAFPSGSRGQTALDCVRAFGSLKEVANSSIKQLLEVKGVGKKKAELIFNHFNRSNNL